MKHLQKSTLLSLQQQLAARMGYTDENYLVWLKAWLTEPLQLKAWANYLEECKTNQNSAGDKASLIDLVIEVLEGDRGEHGQLAHHSDLTQKGVEARFAVQFIRGCRTKTGFGKDGTIKKGWRASQLTFLNGDFRFVLKPVNE